MNKTYIMVDIEANGPIPGDYSMTSLGAVVVDEKLDKTFKVNIKPISDKFDPNRRQFVDTDNSIDAKEAMVAFSEWIKKNVSGKPVFISDNNGFDWMFVCWYLWHFLNENPLGYTSQNLNSIYRGMQKDLSINIDSLRERQLTHDALDDAKDNARVFLKLKAKLKDS
jgi:hypothetical protein